MSVEGGGRNPESVGRGPVRGSARLRALLGIGMLMSVIGRVDLTPKPMASVRIEGRTGNQPIVNSDSSQRK